jgi:hypothetical protein
LLLSWKFLTIDAGSDPFADIIKHGRLVVSIPEDFVGCGPPEMVPSTQAAVKFSYDLLGLLWTYTF